MNEIIELIQRLRENLDDFEEDISGIDAGSDLIRWRDGYPTIAGMSITPAKSADNYNYLYMPNVTTRGPSTKRYRYLDRDGTGIFDTNLVFHTEEEALEAAEAIYAVFSKI